mgnify:CR=1 FL=1
MNPIVLTLRQIRALCRISDSRILFRPRDLVAVSRSHMLVVPWPEDQGRNFAISTSALWPWFVVVGKQVHQREVCTIWDGEGPFRIPHDHVNVELRSGRLLIKRDNGGPSGATIEEILAGCDGGRITSFACNPALLRHLRRAQRAFGLPDIKVGELMGVRLVSALGWNKPTHWAIDTEHGEARFVLMPVTHPAYEAATRSH